MLIHFSRKSYTNTRPRQCCALFLNNLARVLGGYLITQSNLNKENDTPVCQECTMPCALYGPRCYSGIFWHKHVERSEIATEKISIIKSFHQSKLFANCDNNWDYSAEQSRDMVAMEVDNKSTEGSQTPSVEEGEEESDFIRKFPRRTLSANWYIFVSYEDNKEN